MTVYNIKLCNINPIETGSIGLDSSLSNSHVLERDYVFCLLNYGDLAWENSDVHILKSLCRFGIALLLTIQFIASKKMSASTGG